MGRTHGGRAAGTAMLHRARRGAGDAAVSVRLAALGHAVLDLVFEVPRLPDGDSKNFATGLAAVGGGLSANAAVAARRLGAAVIFLGRIGDDPEGERIHAQLAGDGVDTRGLLRVAGAHSPVSCICIDREGRRQIVNYTDPRLYADAEGLDLALLDGVDGVVTDPRWVPGAVAILEAASRAGIASIVDYDRSPDVPDERLLRLPSHVVFAAPGLVQLTGREDLDDGLRAARGLGAREVVVTDGERGARWLDAAGEVRRAPAYRVDTVETLGAGDVFHAAFAVAIAEGAPMAAAIRFASGAAAIKCTRRGARAGAPRRREVEAFLAARQ